jgi:mannose-1-phosphate guanylyltransferase/phosphomannomutase
MTSMNAVIMAGGFGTRLRPLTASVPKPMVPVGDKPLMQHVVEHLARHGFTNQNALLFFQPEVIRDYFQDGSGFGVQMKYRRSDADYGTAGSVRNALDLLEERLVIVSGDVLTDIDLGAAVRFHEDRGASVTMVLVSVPNPTEFGVVITAEDGRIERFLEKPPWGQVISDTINTGMYIIERDVIARLPEKQFVDFSGDLFPRLLSEKAPLYGYIASGYWRDVGSPEAYRQVHDDLFGDVVKLNLPGERREHSNARLYAHASSYIADDAELAGLVVVGSGARIEAGARVVDSVVGGRSVVGTEARLLKSVLWGDVQVGAGAQIRRAVVCGFAQIGGGCQVGEQAVISERVILGRRVDVRPNVRIWPGKTVEEGAIVTDSLVWGDRFNRELFTDAKISGVFNREVTPEFAVRVGGALGAQMGAGKTILASRDPSPASRLLTRSLQSGLCAAGVHVDDLSEVPVPVVRYRLSAGGYAGGFHLRRNVDHSEYVDLFIMDARGRDMGPGQCKSVERLFNREDFYRADVDHTGRIEYPIRVLEGYREGFLAALDVDTLRRRGFHIVADYRRGGGALLAGLLPSLGIDTVTIDSGGPGSGGASAGADFERLGSVVRSLGSDLGVVIHPHAEKFSLLDEQGVPLDPIELQRVIGFLYFALNPSGIVATPVTGSSMLEEYAARGGGHVRRVRGDHQAMMEAADAGAALVIGTRGGFIARAFGPGADAMFGCVYLMQMLAQYGESLSQVRIKVGDRPYGMRSAHCPWEKRGQVMRQLVEWSRSQRADLRDGVRVFENDGWYWTGPDPFLAQFNLVAEGTDAEFVAQRLHLQAEQISRWQADPASG